MPLAQDGGGGDANAAITSGTGTVGSGTWYNCAWLTSDDSYGSSNWDTGSLLLVSQGSSTVATFQGDDQATGTVTLQATSDRSAKLGPPGQSFPGTWEVCSPAATEAEPTLASIDVSSAQLTLDGSALFLSVTGALTGMPGAEGCFSATAPLVTAVLGRDPAPARRSSA